MITLTQIIPDLANAVIVDDRLISFGDAQREFESSLQQPAKCLLSSLGVLELAGADNTAFINAQFTTDCNLLNPDRAQFSAWCDPKGRVLFVFVLMTNGETIYLVAPRAQIEKIMQRLRMYVLRSNVEIRDVSETFAIFGLTLTPPNGFNPVSTVWGTQMGEDDSILMRYAPGQERYWFVAPDSTAQSRWMGLPHQAIGEDAWDAHNCVSGIPQISSETSGEFVAQQLNLDQLGGLSFSKGCFPGQEIIARLKYRGEVKKRVVAARLEGDVTVLPNAKIRSLASNRYAGNVLVGRSLGPYTLLSAVLETAALNDPLELDGAPLEVLPLPYSGE